MKRTNWKSKKIKAKVPRRRVTKTHHQLIAVNLKEKMKHFERHPPDIPGFSISRLQYLISLILTHKQFELSERWAVLNMEYMRNVVPQAGQYMKWLREQGIIEWINYSQGRNSRLYKLVNEGWTEQVPITDMKIIRRIEKNKARLSKRNSKKYPFLNRAVRKTKIDFESALQTIDTRYQKDIASGMEKVQAVDRRNYALGAVIRIQADEKYINWSSTEKRLHTNFTNLPGYLMKYLSIDGHSFIEMDIRNSQPYFAGALFNPTPEVLEVMENYLPSSLLISIKPLLALETQDVKLYRSLVSAGSFYEYMAEQFRERGLAEHTDRKTLKAQIFEVFFGKVHAEKWNDAVSLFKELFPTVHKVFFRIKRKQHNRLAILLQRIESYTMLERVVKDIEAKHPELDMLTKHDSILPVRLLTPEKPGVMESVRQLMVSTITEVTGVRPQGRIKKL